MSNLNGAWLAFWASRSGRPEEAAERLIEAIRRFNERTGRLPTKLVANPHSDAYPHLVEAARRLGLEVIEGPLSPQDFWLGPVRPVKEAKP